MQNPPYGNQRFNMNDITFKIWSTYDHLVQDSRKTEKFYKKLSLGILDYYSMNLSLKQTERTFLPWSYKKLWKFGKNDYNLRKVLKGMENGDKKLGRNNSEKTKRANNWRGVPIPNNLKQKLNPHGSFGVDGLYQNAYNFSAKRVPDENYYRDLWFALIGGKQGWKLSRERNHLNFGCQTITSFLFNLGVSHRFLNGEFNGGQLLKGQFLKEDDMKSGMREIIKNSGIFDETKIEISDQYLEKIIKALSVRPLVEKPENVSFEWISHKSEFDVLQVSDYEKVMYGVSNSDLVEDDGFFLSAKVEFELKKGTYATVALAQLLNSAAVMNPVSGHV